ncbi:MAG TPA: hypothetical protein VFN68_13435 [Acidimicrobiales bacterium]|nr:hypothetical protein [Acidimicrobiales bacterium]
MAAGLTLGMGGFTVASAPAFADCSSYGPSTCTASSSGSPSAPDGGSPTAAPALASGSSALAFTGADVELASAVAAGAIATGGLLVLAGRRRRAAS